MTSEYFVGWELMFHYMEDDVQTKEDVITALIHWVLIKSRYRCIGLNDSSTFTDNTTGSELLPRGWNKKSDSFGIKYKTDNQYFTLKSKAVDDDYFVILIRVADGAVSMLNLKPGNLVMACSGPLEAMVPTYAELCETVRRQLIAPLTTTVYHEAPYQTPGYGTQTPASRFAPDISPRAKTESQYPESSIISSNRSESSAGSSNFHPVPSHAPGQSGLIEQRNREQPPGISPGAGNLCVGLQRALNEIPLNHQRSMNQWDELIRSCEREHSKSPGARVEFRTVEQQSSSGVRTSCPRQHPPGRGNLVDVSGRIPPRQLYPADPGTGLTGDLHFVAVPQAERLNLGFPRGPLSINSEFEETCRTPKTDFLNTPIGDLTWCTLFKYLSIFILVATLIYKFI